MGKLLKSRFAVSSIVAVLIAILLISAFTAALLYISTTQMQSAKTGTETTGEISEKLRENLKAVAYYNLTTGIATFRINNTGDVPLAISYILLVNPDGSLNPIPVQDPGNPGSPVRIIPLESRTFNVTLTGDVSGLGLQTERGNVFPVVISGAVTQQAYTVTFYILDSAGSAMSGATIVFNGASYSHDQSTSVAAGSYPLSTGTIPSGYTFSQWETSGSVTVASAASASTTATVSGGGSITMRLTATAQTATVTFSASGLRSDPSGTLLNVDGVDYSYSQLPVSFTWTVGSSHSFTWFDPISAGSGKQYAWVSTSGLSTAKSGTITVPSGGGAVSATYEIQYYLTMQANPSAGGSVSPGSGWYDAGSSVPISATANSGYAFDQWVGSGSGSYAGTSNPATITMNAPITETAYFFTFSISVSPSSGSTTPGGSVSATVSVSLSGGYSSSITVSLSASGLPSGASAPLSPSSVTISPSSPTATSTVTISTSSSTPPGTYTITISGAGGGLSKSTTYTLTVSTATFTVTFTQTGLPSGTSWSVTFGSQTQSSTGSTITFNNIPAGTYLWSVSSPISGGSGVRYVASPASGSMSVPSQTSQSITYTTQYQWTFSASGLGTDASGTVVTVDGTAYSSLPVSFWWASGSTHSYSYQEYVSSTTSGKRYANHNPPGGTITVSSSGSVNPAYHAEYLLTVNVSPSGAGSVSLNPSSSDGYYDAGTSVTATATANTGYTFSKWQLDGSDYSTSNPTNVNMNAPHSLTAVFTGATYTLTVYVYRSGTTTGISGVTVKVDGNSYTTDSSGKVQVTVSYGSHMVEVVSPYSPSSGTRYVFTQWSDGSASNPRTISVTASTTLTAYVKLQYQLTVAVNPSGGGGVSASPSSSDGYYDSGTSVTLTATANSGYAFDAWTGDASGTSSSTSVSMSAPKSVTANFFTFSISVSPTSGSTPAGGSVTATVTVTYVSGVNSKTISLSASGLPSGASASLSPSSFTVSPSSTATSTMTITTSASTPTGTYTVTVTGSGSGLSKSTPYTLTVTAAVYTVSFYVYDDAGNAVSGATINFAGSSYSHGSSTSVTAGTYSLSTGTIPSGYRFNKWDTGGSVSVASSTSTSTTATVSGTGSITMRLQRVATVTFSASGLGSDAEGTVLNVDGTGYAYADLPKSFTWDVGSQHSFTWALAAGSTTSGKAYVWVSTSGLSTSRGGTITIPSGGGSVTASYKTMYYLTMQVSPTGAGSASPSSGWRDAGSSVSISATANSGYQFSRWSGSGTDSYSGTNNPASVTMNGPITETAIFKVGITFDALKTSGARFNSNPTYSVLYVAGKTYYYSQLPITFYWEVGSSHYVSWYDVYSDESTYLSGSDVDYVWSYSTGIFTSKRGTLTVPSSGGSVTAYYNRYVEVIVDKEPYNGGTVSPSSDWYLEGQAFTATANSGYQFHHWSIDNGASTSTSNPYYAWNPHYLKAVFYIRVNVYAYDSENNAFPNIYVSCGPNSGYTNSYGCVDLYVPYGYNTLSTSSSGTGYGGKSLPFWKWSDDEASTSRTIYVYEPTYYTAYYKCVLWFKEIYAEHRCGPGTWFADVYRTWGYVHVTTARSEYSKSSINVKAVWHIHTEDLFGSHYYTREATGTTDYNGYFDFSTSGYDYFEIFADLWVEVSTQAEERYVNAYWTARYPFS